MQEKLIFKSESYTIIGACFAVYKDKGCGFLEPVFQECMEIELAHHSIPFVAQMPFSLQYRGVTLRQTFRPDLVCYEKILVELKAVSQLADDHRAQVINYLNATGYELGLLVNFGHYPQLEYERIVKTKARVPSPEDIRF